MVLYDRQPNRVGIPIVDAQKSNLIDRELGISTDVDKAYLVINGTVYELLKVGDPVQNVGSPTELTIVSGGGDGHIRISFHRHGGGCGQRRSYDRERWNCRRPIGSAGRERCQNGCLQKWGEFKDRVRFQSIARVGQIGFDLHSFGGVG